MIHEHWITSLFESCSTTKVWEFFLGNLRIFSQKLEEFYNISFREKFHIFSRLFCQHFVLSVVCLVRSLSFRSLSFRSLSFKSLGFLFNFNGKMKVSKVHLTCHSINGGSLKIPFKYNTSYKKTLKNLTFALN